MYNNPMDLHLNSIFGDIGAPPAAGQQAPATATQQSGPRANERPVVDSRSTPATNSGGPPLPSPVRQAYATLDHSTAARRAEKAEEKRAEEKRAEEKRTAAGKPTPNDKKSQRDAESRFAVVTDAPEAAQEDGQGGSFLDAFDKRNTSPQEKPPRSTPPQAAAPRRQFKSPLSRMNPLYATQDAGLRYQRILHDLRAANHLFDQWDEDTEAEDIRHLYKDGSSELHDHWENIRWATQWLVDAQNIGGSDAPDRFPIAALNELQSVIDHMESHLAELMDPHNAMIETFTDYFETPLAQVRKMQATINDAIYWAKTAQNPGFAQPSQHRSNYRTRQISSVEGRLNPHFNIRVTPIQRNKAIISDLQAANRLFARWDERSDTEQIQKMYVNNHNSELNDHWENIMEAEKYLTSVKHNTNSHAPENYSLSLLLDIQAEVDKLVERLVLLTDEQSVEYEFFFWAFQFTLAEARRMKVILDDAVDKAKLK
jgi:hypothetical protein